MPSVNIIGAGRVGRTFLSLLGDQVQDISSATRKSADEAVLKSGHGHAADLADMRAADLWLLTVPDTEIAMAAQSLADTQDGASIAIHCSGFHCAEIMEPLRQKGWHLASAHPNLSFAEPEIAALHFPGTPCGLEGDALAIEATEMLLGKLGAHTFRIPSARKALYHAAAVFSNNFATILQAIAREAWKEAGVPDEVAAQINESLLNATAENVSSLGPVGALTGPAARGDMAVVEAQAQQVADWNAEAGQLYSDLSQLALRLKSTGSL